MNAAGNPGRSDRNSGRWCVRTAGGSAVSVPAVALEDDACVRRSRSRPHRPRSRRGTAPAVSSKSASRLRIFGSSLLSAGLPSTIHSASASRSAGTPARPCREWTRAACSASAVGDAKPCREHDIQTRVRAPGRSTAARSARPAQDVGDERVLAAHWAEVEVVARMVDDDPVELEPGCGRRTSHRWDRRPVGARPRAWRPTGATPSARGCERQRIADWSGRRSDHRTVGRCRGRHRAARQPTGPGMDQNPVEMFRLSRVPACGTVDDQNPDGTEDRPDRGDAA